MSDGLKIALGSLLGVVNILLGIIYAGLRSDLAKVSESLERVTTDLTNERLANVAGRAEITRLSTAIEQMTRENRQVLIEADTRHHDTLREILKTCSAAQLEAFEISKLLRSGT